MSRAFWGTNPNLNWAVNRLNQKHSSLIGIIDGIIGGNGQIAPSAEVEKAVQWAIDKATNNFITYSQSNRNLKNPNGLSYDCSSFIITAFFVGGFNIEATYTGNMIAGFTARGWKWMPGAYWTSDKLQRGDILLNIANHTQMYIGNNQDVNCGATPARVIDHCVDYYGQPWDGILRYEG